MNAQMRSSAAAARKPSTWRSAIGSRTTRSPVMGTRSCRSSQLTPYVYPLALAFESTSPEETERIAAQVARALEPGDVVYVSGELGSGKTTFVRGACRALGVSGPVTSPTYTIG